MTDPPSVPGSRPRQDETPGSRGLSEDARARIGHGLRALYGDLPSAPVPERFSRLLGDLAQGRGARRAHDDSQEMPP
ncbi:MAG: NepR family anti-sigma factor [Methylobacterium frigidaeris]